MNRTAVFVTDRAAATPTAPDYGAPDWRFALPTLADGDVVLREVHDDDAAALATLLTAPAITRFISPPPLTVEGFERFIAGSQRLRLAGKGACFAITRRGYSSAIGIIQVRLLTSRDEEPRQLGGTVGSAEWGFALGTAFWGTGVFQTAARLAAGFAFEQMGVHRLEARCAVKNGRAGHALRKLGATPEGVLRNALPCRGEYLDQVLYSIVAPEWRLRHPAGVTVHRSTLH
jgi:ribosomal-protein-alanine N-acetyltransferase